MLHVTNLPPGVATAPRALGPLMIARHWRRWWLLGLGGSLLGVIAMAAPATGWMSGTTVLAIVLLGNAVLRVLHIRLLPRYAGTGWHLVEAAVAVIAVALLLAPPPADLFPPNLVTGLFLLLSGIGRGFLGATVEPLRGWYWLCAVGIATSVLGAVVLVLYESLPTTLLSASVGLALLLDGIWTLQTGRKARRHSIAALLPHWL